MRHIDRLAEPAILTRKKDEWLAKFLSSNKARPDSSKYGHDDILDTLKNMSYNKCFYSEAYVTVTPSNVDHLMEVALDKTKAFEWDNLYLSIPECNQGRPDNNSIPIANVLDPCKDSDEEIQANLTFENEQAVANNGSQKGLDTIRKYKLNNKALLYKRLKYLQSLYGFIQEKQDEREKAGRVHFSEDELRQIRAWVSPDREFSLMVEVYLNKIHLV